MKKTKREFLRVFREKFSDQANYSPGAAAELAAVIAAESVGVVWEPEEEPLPNRLAVNAGAIYDPGSGEPVARIIPGPTSRQRSIEAVRRYNAWPMLEELALRDESISLTEAERRLHRLAAILDGKEGA